MTSTAPSVSTTVLTFVLVIGWRLGEPFRVQTPFLLTQGSGASCRKTLKCGSGSPHQLPRQRRGTTSTTSVSAGSKPSGNGTERSYSDSGGVEDTARPARAVATAAANGTSKDRDAEAERLRQEVFANEKGFLESQAFNPRRAKEKEEEEEVRRMAAQWGSTPEKAREVLTKTSSKEDLSFQELESIARDLNLADEQQRVFMMKAGIKKLADATTLPKRRQQQQQQQQHRDPVGEAVTERIFAAETGFVQNSEEFKNKLKAGSGVRFDLKGLPLLDEGDPVVQATRQSKQNATFDLEGIVFPTLPDCPRCSTPTTEEELSQFNMCAQCKAHEISAVVYTGPSSPSKYTYDTGEPPFSDSWQQRNAGLRSDKATKSEEEGSATFRGSGGGSRDAAGPDPGVAKVVTALTRGHLGSGAKLRRGTLARRSPVPPPGDRKAWPPPGPDEPVLPPSQQQQQMFHEAAAGAATAPAGTVSSSPSPRPGGAPSSTKSYSPDRDHPSYYAAAGVTAQLGPSDRPLRRNPSRGQSAPPPQAAAAGATVEETAAVVRRLSGEVAEFRSKLAALGAAMRSNKVGGTKEGQEGRDSAAAPPIGPAMRELRREVAELRSALKAVAGRQAEAERSKAAGSSDSSSIYRSNSADSVISSGGGEGATIVRKLSREVTELRSQLEQARREQSLTQLALRRLREQVDSLTAGGTTQ